MPGFLIERWARFWADRWAGRATAGTVLWRDMLGVGTVLNLAASLLALALASQGVPAGWAVALHLAPVPYNAFLLRALLRAPASGPLTRLTAVGWFLAMLVV